MFLDFYHLREQPFKETPDAQYLYQGRTHSQILIALAKCLESGCRVQTLISPPGTGKTSILLALLERARRVQRTAYVWQTQWDSAETLGFILRELGVDHGSTRLTQRRHEMDRFIKRENRWGRRVLLVLDEAQNLHSNVLEELNALLDRSPSALQLVLSGQPHLTKNLEDSRHDGLRSYIDAEHTLGTLDAVETARYIQHRIEVAGYNGPQLFTPEALEKISIRSEGIPRNINTLCFHALAKGAAVGKRVIDGAIIEDVLFMLPSTDTGLLETASSGPALPLTAHVNPFREEGGVLPPEIANKAVSIANSENDEVENETDFAHAIRRWMKQSATMWIGTSGELLGEFQAMEGREYDRIRGMSPFELFGLFEQHTAELNSVGIEVHTRNQPGLPRLISLRLVDRDEPEQVQSEAGSGLSAQATASAEGSMLPAQPEDRDVPEQPSPELESQEVASFGSWSSGTHEVGVPRVFNFMARVLRRRSAFVAAIAALLTYVFAVTPVGKSYLQYQVQSVFARSSARDDAPSSRGVADPVQRLRVSAEQGDASAQYTLALRHQSGEGVPQDRATALNWYRKAAEQGYVEAQYQLGMALAEGAEGAPDDVAAYTWLVLADAAGHPHSSTALKTLTPKLTASDIREIRRRLGEMYAAGIGTREDNVRAYTWFTLAEAAGDQRSAERKRMLEPRMTGQQIATASQRASDWLSRRQR